MVKKARMAGVEGTSGHRSQPFRRPEIDLEEAEVNIRNRGGRRGFSAALFV
jgi:hypothetical protein